MRGPKMTEAQLLERIQVLDSYISDVEMKKNRRHVNSIKKIAKRIKEKMKAKNSN